MGSIAFAFIAGLLSTLSPCVLPLLPIVVGAATSEHRLGPAALSTGLTLSFVALGLLIATLGFAIGLEPEVFRSPAAILLILFGVVLLMPRLQAQFASSAGPISNWAQSHVGGISGRGWQGQFVVGLLLGAVWSPCVGPTLGAASVLAARAENLAGVALIMVAFGIGAAMPLLVIGLISREALAHWRSRLLAAGGGGKIALGVILLAVGGLVLTGLDKRFEALLVAASPAWLTALATRF
jgi:cytochrome c biogenesis protein CcdA